MVFFVQNGFKCRKNSQPLMKKCLLPSKVLFVTKTTCDGSKIGYLRAKIVIVGSNKRVKMYHLLSSNISVF